MTPSAAEPPSRGFLGRVAGRVTERVVETVQPDLILDHVDLDAQIARVDLDAVMRRIDVDELARRIDLDALMARIDLDALVARVDLDAVLGRVDVDQLVDRVDPNALLDRVEPNALLDRVEPNALLDRVEPNALLDRMDIDALLARVDIRALVARSGVADVVAQSTTHMATSVLDVARRQIVGLDTVLNRAVARVLHRDLAHQPQAPPALASIAAPLSATVRPRRSVTGHYAGAIPRGLAAILDVLVVFTTYSVGYTGVGVLTSAFLGFPLADYRTGTAATVVFVVWAFLYLFGLTAVTGRTVGKAVLGLRVVCASGATVTVARAFVRTLALPLSAALFGLGLLLCVVHPRRSTLHDLVARTAVVHDWGDRPAELSAPLSAFLDRASAHT